MGMLLRRHDRKADRTPKVNGKPVKEEPKKKNLAEKKPTFDNGRGFQKTPNYR